MSKQVCRISPGPMLRPYLPCWRGKRQLQLAGGEWDGIGKPTGHPLDPSTCHFTIRCDPSCLQEDLAVGACEAREKFLCNDQ